MGRWLLCITALLVCASSEASLGKAPSNFSGATPAVKARALAAGTPAPFTVSESTLPSGTVVREYVASGTVFAVSWNGPFMPDLRTLLGEHFNTMTHAAAQRPQAGHSQLTVNGQDVVIVSGGHMRAYLGKAWIPSALPAGVTPDDID